MASNREPFGGRYFGIFYVEGDDPSPVFMVRGYEDAERERGFDAD